MHSSTHFYPSVPSASPSVSMTIPLQASLAVSESPDLWRAKSTTKGVPGTWYSQFNEDQRCQPKKNPISIHIPNPLMIRVGYVGPLRRSWRRATKQNIPPKEKPKIGCYIFRGLAHSWAIGNINLATSFPFSWEKTIHQSIKSSPPPRFFRAQRKHHWHLIIRFPKFSGHCRR